MGSNFIFEKKRSKSVKSANFTVFSPERNTKNFKVNSNLGHVFTRNKSKTSLSYTQLLPNKCETYPMVVVIQAHAAHEKTEAYRALFHPLFEISERRKFGISI